MIFVNLPPSEPESAPRSPAHAWKSHTHNRTNPVTRMHFVEAVYEDGSSIADYSTPRKSHGQRDSRRSIITPTHHEEVNMQLLPIEEPLVTPPAGLEYAHITGSFDSAATPSDHGVFDSRNGGGPVRGLYRNTELHHQQLIEEQMIEQSAERQAYEKAVEDSDSEWAAKPVTWGLDIANMFPKENIGARQLAALKPRHRNGIYVPTQASPVTTMLTPMDTENASREWQVHPLSFAKANAIFNDSSVLATNPISTDPRDLDLPRVKFPTPRTGWGHAIKTTVAYKPSINFKSHTSIMRSDAFDAAVLRMNDAMSLPFIPTGSDIIRAAQAAAANEQLIASTPEVFGQHVMRNPARPPLGKMTSTVHRPRSVEEGAKANHCFTEGRTSEQILTLVRTLESERNELSAQNQGLSMSLYANRIAYNALQYMLTTQMKRLAEENANLRDELEQKDSLVKEEEQEIEGGGLNSSEGIKSDDSSD